MKLHTWLKRHGKTATWLARQTGLSASQVSRVITGERSPSLDACEKIAEATNGEVTADDFMRRPGGRVVGLRSEAA